MIVTQAIGCSYVSCYRSQQLILHTGARSKSNVLMPFFFCQISSLSLSLSLSPYIYVYIYIQLYFIFFNFFFFIYLCTSCLCPIVDRETRQSSATYVPGAMSQPLDAPWFLAGRSEVSRLAHSFVLPIWLPSSSPPEVSTLTCPYVTFQPTTIYQYIDLHISISTIYSSIYLFIIYISSIYTYIYHL